MSKIILPALLLSLGAISSASAATNVISNDFGAGVDIGPSWAGGAFGNTSNVNASTGVLTLSGGANNYNACLYTSSAVDVSAASSFTMTWSISSGSNFLTSSGGSGVWHNGLFFGVAKFTTTPAGFETADYAFGVNLVKGSEPAGWVVVDANNSGGNAYLTQALSGTAPTQASMEDGFTLSLTLNSDNSYSITTTGLSNTNTHTGTLAGTKATFANLAASLRAYTSVGGGGVVYTVDSATLTAVPEPSAVGLISLAGLTLLLRRRR